MISCIFENGNRTSLRHIVVHALVEKNNSLLLEKRAGDILESGKWSLPGGFLDRDETGSQAVIRELKEETGLEGEVISLFRINTNPQRPKKGRQITKLLPFSEFAFDHGESIKLYLEYRKNPHPIPLLI